MPEKTEREILSEFNSVVSLLSKEDALKVLVYANDGGLADSKAPKRVGVTRKQYYTREKQLTDLGLMEREDNHYKLTIKGEFVYKKRNELLQGYTKIHPIGSLTRKKAEEKLVNYEDAKKHEQLLRDALGK